MKTLLLLPLLFATALHAQTYNFDALPNGFDFPEAFPAVNFGGGAEVWGGNARSAPNSVILYGNDNSATQSYGYYTAYAVNIAVTAGTRLDYWVMPAAGGSNFSVDLAFSDGTYLRDSDATDQFGVRMHPNYQGAGGHLPLNSYTQVISNIGEWVAGKTITQIILAFDRPPATGWVVAYFDDITISQRTVLACTDPGVTCGTTLCTVGCNESALRAAVQAANDCNANPAFTRRTIAFPSSCTSIDLANTSASAAGQAICSTETDPVFKYSVCITGHDVWVDAGNATVNYSGTVPCDPAADSAGPPPFVLRGTRGAVRRLTTQFFPEGILVRTGTDNKIENLTSQYICDEAVSVGDPTGSPPASAPVNTVVRYSTLTGTTSHARCTGSCGVDKAIQLNSGTNTTVLANQFFRTNKAVLVKAGTATIGYNAATGDPSNQNVSDSFSVAGGTVTVIGNAITRHKFGIRVEGTGAIDAINNTVKDCYLSAFSVRDSGKLRGAGNRIKNCGFFAGSSCQRAGVAAWNSSSAQVDFGGGHCTTGAEVIAGKGVSPGGNVFCQASMADFYNTAWSTPATCTGTSSTACMRGQNNCFDLTAANVIPSGTVSTTGSGTGCDCSF